MQMYWNESLQNTLQIWYTGPLKKKFTCRCGGSVGLTVVSMCEDTVAGPHLCIKTQHNLGNLPGVLKALPVAVMCAEGYVQNGCLCDLVAELHAQAQQIAIWHMHFNPRMLALYVHCCKDIPTSSGHCRFRPRHTSQADLDGAAADYAQEGEAAMMVRGLTIVAMAARRLLVAPQGQRRRGRTQVQH